MAAGYGTLAAMNPTRAQRYHSFSNGNGEDEELGINPTQWQLREARQVYRSHWHLMA